MFSVPPFSVEAFTTLVEPALKAAVPVLDEDPLELLPLLLHALAVRAVTAPSATAANMPRLFMP